MKKNQELFKEAIADAKAVRDAALANAKKTLEENLMPQFQSAINKQLAEIEEQELEETQEKNEGLKDSNVQQMEEELDSLLQELGLEENSDLEESNELEEGSDEEMYENADLEESEELEETSDLEETELGLGEAEDEELEAPEASEEEPSDDSDHDFGGEGEEQPEEVVDLTVDELTDIIRNVVHDAISGGSGEETGDLASEPGLDGGEGGEQPSGDEEVDLDELAANNDINIDTDPTSNLQEGKQWYMSKKAKGSKQASKAGKVDETKAWYSAKTAKGSKQANKPGKVDESGSLLKIKKNKNHQAPVKGKVSESGSLLKIKKNKNHQAPVKGKVNEVEKDLKEAINTIKNLQESLSSINLLNAKLLYVNKIFNGKNLNESQKVKVIAAFDKARTKEEAKTIFESLNETLNTKKKSTIKESLGFASKSVGGAPAKKDVIVEDAQVTRWKKLAGIITD